MGSAGCPPSRVVSGFHLPQERETGRGGVGRDREARPRPRVEGDRVDPRQQLQVLVEETVALGVVRRDRQVDEAPRRSITSAYGSSQRPYAWGTGRPCASSRSCVATSSAMRYGMTMRGSRSPRAWSGSSSAVDLHVDVPRRAPPGMRSMRVTVPPRCARPTPRAGRPRRSGRLHRAHVAEYLDV